MSKLYTIIYTAIPSSLKMRLGKSRFLKPLRDFILRPNGKFKEIEVTIQRSYSGYNLRFKFIASLKTAVTAKTKGVENTIINNSMNLVESYKSHKDDCVVIDVGANFGYLSLAWAKSISQNGTVHAFESNDYVCETLNKTVKKNALDHNITVNSCAVGKENGEVKMYYTDTYSNLNNVFESNKQNTVEMVTLDTYMDRLILNRCDLIKIDVDGSELDVLEGSVKLLRKLNPIYIVETNGDKNLVNFFLKHNYKILNMNLATISENDPIPLNIFCVPN